MMVQVKKLQLRQQAARQRQQGQAQGQQPAAGERRKDR